jgi:hypothetical protein
MERFSNDSTYDHDHSDGRTSTLFCCPVLGRDPASEARTHPVEVGTDGHALKRRTPRRTRVQRIHPPWRRLLRLLLLLLLLLPHCQVYVTFSFGLARFCLSESARIRLVMTNLAIRPSKEATATTRRVATARHAMMMNAKEGRVRLPSEWNRSKRKTRSRRSSRLGRALLRIASRVKKARPSLPRRSISLLASGIRGFLPCRLSSSLSIWAASPVLVDAATVPARDDDHHYQGAKCEACFPCVGPADGPGQRRSPT